MKAKTMWKIRETAEEWNLLDEDSKKDILKDCGLPERLAKENYFFLSSTIRTKLTISHMAA